MNTCLNISIAFNFTAWNTMINAMRLYHHRYPKNLNKRGVLKIYLHLTHCVLLTCNISFNWLIVTLYCESAVWSKREPGGTCFLYKWWPFFNQIIIHFFLKITFTCFRTDIFVYVYVTMWIWREEQNFRQSVFSFHYVGPADLTQVIRLSDSPFTH